MLKKILGEFFFDLKLSDYVNMSSFNSTTDHEDLIARLHNGDVTAYEEIFNTHWKRLYKIALNSLRSHEEAEEIVQEFFISLWQQRSDLKILNLSAYLSSSVRKRVIDSIRHRIVHDKKWQYYKVHIPVYGASADEGLVFNDLNNQLQQAINRLPEKSRIVFQLNRLEGKPVSEIAKFLKISERGIEYHLTKSVRLIRDHLKELIFFLILVPLHLLSFWCR